MHLRFLLALLPFLLSAFNGGAGDNSDGDDGNEGDGDGDTGKNGKPEGITDDIQKWVSGLIAKAERDGKRKGKEAAEAAIQTTREQEEADRKRAADEAKGDYETAKKAISDERDGFKTRAEQAEAERDAFRDLVTKDVEAAWDKLPEEIREAYDGEDDDVLAKKRHMRRMAKVIEKLTAEEAKPGNGPNPKPAGNTKPEIPSALPKQRLFS